MEWLISGIFGNICLSTKEINLGQSYGSFKLSRSKVPPVSLQCSGRMTLTGFYYKKPRSKFFGSAHKGQNGDFWTFTGLSSKSIV